MPGPVEDGVEDVTRNGWKWMEDGCDHGQQTRWITTCAIADQLYHMQGYCSPRMKVGSMNSFGRSLPNALKASGVILVAI